MEVLRVLLDWIWQAVRIAVPIIGATAFLVWLRGYPDEYFLGLGAVFGAAAIWAVVRVVNRTSRQAANPAVTNPDAPPPNQRQHN